MRLLQYLTELGNKKLNIQITRDNHDRFNTKTDIADYGSGKFQDEDTEPIFIQYLANEIDPMEVIDRFNYEEISKLLNLKYFPLPTKDDKVKLKKHRNSKHLLEREFNNLSIWWIEFSRVTSSEQTHDELKSLPIEQVMSTFAAVKQSTDMLIQKRKPDLITFAGKKSESARLKVYDKIKFKGYKLIKTYMERGDKVYVFSK